MQYIGFMFAALVLLGLLGLAWYAWFAYTRRTREEADYERTIADLNDDQANRLNDQQLRRPIDADTGWQLMVQRGQRRQRKRRPRRR